MYMNIALILALETKYWGHMFVAFLFRVSLNVQIILTSYTHYKSV